MFLEAWNVRCREMRTRSQGMALAVGVWNGGATARYILGGLCLDSVLGHYGETW